MVRYLEDRNVDFRSLREVMDKGVGYAEDPIQTFARSHLIFAEIKAQALYPSLPGRLCLILYTLSLSSQSGNTHPDPALAP